MTDSWDPALYDDKHSFVWKLSSALVDLLSPRPGERILDLGCGTGQLTAQIAAAGAEVFGLDNSPAMIAESRRHHPDIKFQVADAHDFAVPAPVDAVFSNAALHWIREPERVVHCIARALKPNGRLVVEFGGRGNVRRLAASIEAACQSVIGKSLPHPWYFPSIAEFSGLLEREGLEVTQAALLDRPTPLDGDEGLRNWVRMFGVHWLSQLPTDRQEEFFQHLESLAGRDLQNDDGWYADYRRLRVTAVNWGRC